MEVVGRSQARLAIFGVSVVQGNTAFVQEARSSVHMLVLGEPETLDECIALNVPVESVFCYSEGLQFRLHPVRGKGRSHLNQL